MKKAIIFALVFVVTCFVSCGNSSSDTAENSSSQTTTTAETTTTKTPETTTTTTTQVTTTTETTTTTEETTAAIPTSNEFIDSCLYVFPPDNGCVKFLFGTRYIGKKSIKEYLINFSLYTQSGEPAIASLKEPGNDDGNTFNVSWLAGYGSCTDKAINTVFSASDKLYSTTYDRISIDSVMVTYTDDTTETFDPKLSERINPTLTKTEDAFTILNKKFPAYLEEFFERTPDGNYRSKNNP